MTSDYRTAQSRLVECLRWFHKMNRWNDLILTAENPDFHKAKIWDHDIHIQERHLKELIQQQVIGFVSDSWPLEQERLFARKSFVSWYHSLADQRPNLSWNFILNGNDRGATRRRFELQNAEAQQYHNDRTVVEAFENGRRSIQQAFSHRVVPESFSQNPFVSITPSLVPDISEEHMRAWRQFSKEWSARVRNRSRYVEVYLERVAEVLLLQCHFLDGSRKPTLDEIVPKSTPVALPSEWYSSATGARMSSGTSSSWLPPPPPAPSPA